MGVGVSAVLQLDREIHFARISSFAQNFALELWLH